MLRSVRFSLILLLAGSACPLAPAAPDAAVTTDAGLDLDVSVVDGRALLHVDLPDGTMAVQLALTGAPLDVRLEVEGWSSPSAVVVGVDAGRLLTAAELEWTGGTGRGLAGPCRVRAGYGAAAFLCPNALDPLWVGGQHVITLRADGWTGTLHASLRTVGPVPDRDRIIDVTLHIPPGLEVAESVELRATTLLLPAGVRLVVEREVSETTALVLDAVTLRSETLAALQPTSPGLDVFLLASLAVVDSLGQTRSVASLVTSLPSDVGGASLAGLILLNKGFAGMDDAQLSTLLAHEVGHALGLFHPVEFASADGSRVTDPLADTPDTVDDATLNLMHHTPREMSVRISPDQRTVLRRHPGLR